jgi:hypothetical protein
VELPWPADDETSDDDASEDDVSEDESCSDVIKSDEDDKDLDDDDDEDEEDDDNNDDDDDDDDEEEDEEPELTGTKPGSNTSIRAVAPFSAVTTQNAAPPAPSLDSEDVTVFTAFRLGSMLQGSPLQLPPSQTILTPKLGKLLLNEPEPSR